MKIAIVIPTYNEKNNIGELIENIFSIKLDFDLFIVDDNSPDGTGELVEEFSKNNSRIHLITKQKKEGIGPAYLYGFTQVINQNYEYIIQMDADMSHNPKDIPQMIKKTKNCDVVIGSRYSNGISVINWPLKRLMLSCFANFFARILSGVPIKDSTGGFKCFKAEVLQEIDFNKIKSNGYFFQIEMNYFSYKLGYKICEIPIVFTDRHAGTSKMSRKIIIEAFLKLFFLRFKRVK